MVNRRFSPLSDAFDDRPPGTLTWLQAWYASQCDGDWEHAHGITIDTLDNPGWTVRIQLTGTALAGRPLARRETRRSEHDWLVVWVEGDCFQAACGPLNLGEALHEFRLFADGPPAGRS